MVGTVKTVLSGKRWFGELILGLEILRAASFKSQFIPLVKKERRVKRGVFALTLPEDTDPKQIHSTCGNKKENNDDTHRIVTLSYKKTYSLVKHNVMKLLKCCPLRSAKMTPLQQASDVSERGAGIAP